MIGHGESGHAQLLRAVGEEIDPAASVQQATIRVDVKMDEWSLSGGHKTETQVKNSGEQDRIF